jgi:hypothetical protein
MIGLVVSAASGMAEMAQQQQAADNQNALYEQNKMNATVAFQNKQVDMNNRISQERESAAAENFDNHLAAQKALATNAVAAGENGVAGHTIDALMGDIQGQASRQQDRVNTNLDWTVNQLQNQKKGQSYEALDRINSVKRADPPNFMGSMLKIVGGGLSQIKPGR